MNTNVVDIKPARYGSVITADAAKDGIPDRIEVMRAGSWPEHNNKGRAMTITANDLQEFADNFKAGIGVPGGKGFGQIPIDFAHNDNLEAAGWITDLNAENGILYASVSWTSAGKAALEGGLYKCFSPSFWPACLGEYPDPENHQKTARNVLVGGGLTNIPFFKDLSAIMASNAGNGKDDKNNKGAEMPTLDEVRIKEVASLTADDKALLVKANTDGDLSTNEQTKFAAVLADTLTDEQKKAKADADAKAEADKQAKIAADAKMNGLNDEDAKMLADLKSGKFVEASKYNALEQTVNKLEADNKASKEREVKASVANHVARGAIKADQADKWSERIMADASFEDMLKDLPSNKILAAEIGNDAGEGNGTVAFETKVAEAMKADSKLTYSQAVTQVANADSELAKSHEQQTKNKN
jgi:hypothetical protein